MRGRYASRFDPSSSTRRYSAPNGAYIYRNKLDGKWWIDAPDGNGVYIAAGPAHAPPSNGYEVLGAGPPPASIRIFRA